MGDMQPIRDNQPYWILFFIILIMLCDNFTRMRGGGNLFMTEEQTEWVRTQNILLRVSPTKVTTVPKNPILEKIFHFSRSKKVVCVQLINLVLSIIVEGCYSFGQDDGTSKALGILRLICSVLFWLDFGVELLSKREYVIHESYAYIDCAMCVFGDAFIINSAATGSSFFLIPPG